MGNCETCGYAILDEQFGEFKCRIRQHRVYKPEEMINCEWYKKKEKGKKTKDENV